MAADFIGYGLASSCALVCAVMSYRRRSYMGLIAGMMFTAVTAVDLSYLTGIMADTYFKTSLWMSSYFVCQDILMLNMVCYAVEFTRPRTAVMRYRKMLYIAVGILVFIDLAGLMINIFQEILPRYQHSLDGIHGIQYRYESQWTFHFHTVLMCLMAGIAILSLVCKIFRVPRIYRARYTYSLLWISAVVVFHIGSMTESVKPGFDAAVLVCSFGCPLVYRNTFDYASRSILNMTRRRILEYMGTPMVLFDHEGYVADTNQDMRDLFPILNDRGERISMMDFLQSAAFEKSQDAGTDQVFEWNNPAEAGGRRYHCDLTCLRDEKGCAIGRFLVLKNMELERDMLTQLYSRNSFYGRMEKVLSRGVYPVTVVVCNTNGIGLINEVYGWTAGNKLLRQAADLLRGNLPEDTILARLEDGDMAAGLMEAEQEHAVRLFEKIREQYRESSDTGMHPDLHTDLEYGIAVIGDHTKSIEEAVREAGQSMRTKKLMSRSSRKSSLLDSLTQTLMESDHETEEHMERTREMATRLGYALHLTDVELGRLALLAVLHDIGKIAIPHAILAKPGKLTEAEWEIMKTHTEKGYRIANASKELQPIGEYILHHHERWDGRGYPGGLAREEIPLLSRIITVVDSHDVMVHDRPYHKAMSQAAAAEELRRCSGAQFDPHLVDVFLEVLEEKVS